MTTSIPVSIFWFLVGLAIVLAVGSSILRTLVVPRGVRSKLSALVLTATLGAFRTRRPPHVDVRVAATPSWPTPRPSRSSSRS